MKAKQFKVELRQLDKAALDERLDFLKKELFQVRLSVVTSHVKDYSQFKKLRKNIAQVLTQLRTIDTN